MTTLRQRSKTQSILNSWSSRFSYQGKTVYNTNTNLIALSYQRTMTDLIQSNALMKPCSMSQITYTATPANAELWLDKWHSVANGMWFGGSSDTQYIVGTPMAPPILQYCPELYWDSQDNARAAVDVYSSFAPDALLGATCFELLQFKTLVSTFTQALPKVSEAFMSPLPRLSRRARETFLTQAKRRGLRGGKAFLKEMANIYLGWSFGVVPLLRDISTLYDTVVKTIGAPLRPTIETYHGFYSKTGTVSQVGVTTHGNGSNIPNHSSSSTFRRLTKANTVRVEWEVSHISEVQQRLGYMSNRLGLYALCGTLWEIIPFSFMVDWVIPAGSIVKRIDETLMYRPRFNILDSCGSLLTEKITNGNFTSVGPGMTGPARFTYFAKGTLGTYTIISETYNRSVPGDLAYPFWDKVPGLDGKKLSYVGAIAIQKLTK